MTIRPMEHQAAAAPWYRDRQGRGGLFWEPGCGKTIAELLAILEAPMPTLVIAPPAVTEAAWAADAERCNVECVVIAGSPAKRREIIERNAGRENVLAVASMDLFRKQDESDWWMDELGIRRLIIDESSKVSNYDAGITKRCMVAALRVDSIHLLSGTPAPNGPHQYWSQLAMIDPTNKWALADRPGSSNGSPNFWRWSGHWLNAIKRTKTIYDRNGRPRTVEYVARWMVKDERREAFVAMLERVFWSLRKEDCMDLPEKMSIAIPVALRRDERKAYDQLKEEAAVSIRARRRQFNLNAILAKVRQAAGGFVYDDQQPSGVLRIGESKLLAFDDLVDRLAPHPLVVWCEFREEIERADEILRSYYGEGRVAILAGSTGGGSRRKREIVDGFQAGDLDAVVCHPASVGHGVTLTRASHAIYLSMSFSWDQHGQSQDRIHRRGQHNPCTYYHIIAKDTVDEAIHWTVTGKKKQSDEILDRLRRTL